MQEFKVLHIIDHMGLGGAQRAIADQMKYRTSDYLFIISNQKNISVDLDPERIIFHGILGLRDLIQLFKSLHKAINHREFEIVHAHLKWSWALGLFISVFYAKKIKLVFHERGPILFNGLIYKTLAKACAKQGIIWAISQSTAQALITCGVSEESIRVLYNGLETSYFYPDAEAGKNLRKKFNIPPEAFVVGFTGRLEKRKGWRDYIEALALLSKTHPQIIGLIAGNGSEINLAREFINRLNLDKRVIIIGAYKEMRHYYNALNALVFPSHFEPLGRVHLEAQACQIPIIASYTSGAIETISEENAILVSVGNINQITQSIIALAENEPLRNALGIAGLKNARRFKMQYYLKNINKLYQEVISEN